MSAEPYVLTLSCPNRPGIVAAVSTHLFESGCNILDAGQFDDIETGRFFMRVVFNLVADAASFDEVRRGFAPVAGRFGMEFSVRRRADHRRVLLLVSRFDHCLADLLYRWRTANSGWTRSASCRTTRRRPTAISTSAACLSTTCP